MKAGGFAIKAVLPLFLILGLASSCSHSIRPMAVSGPSGPVYLNSSGVFVGDGTGLRKLPDGGITALHAVGGAVWGTCKPGCGARRLLPEPGTLLVKQDGLLDDRVAMVAGTDSGTRYYSYDRDLDLGISVQSGTSWIHYSPANSALASGRIAELVSDAQGGIWVKYARDRLGVARIADGRVVNYTTANSDLPCDSVDMLMPEPSDNGLAGDQIWLVTVDGLTRFEPAKNDWKHYGRRHGDATDFLRMSGMDKIFDKAITGINGIAFTAGEAWISTRNRIHRFDGTTFRPLPDNILEGLERRRYSSIASMGGVVWVTLENLDSRKQEAIASWSQEKGWRNFPFGKYGLPVARSVSSGIVKEEIVFMADEWGSRILLIDAAGTAPIVIAINTGKGEK